MSKKILWQMDNTAKTFFKGKKKLSEMIDCYPEMCYAFSYDGVKCDKNVLLQHNPPISKCYGCSNAYNYLQEVMIYERTIQEDRFNISLNTPLVILETATYIDLEKTEKFGYVMGNNVNEMFAQVEACCKCEYYADGSNVRAHFMYEKSGEVVIGTKIEMLFRKLRPEYTPVLFKKVLVMKKGNLSPAEINKYTESILPDVAMKLGGV